MHKSERWSRRLVPRPKMNYPQFKPMKSQCAEIERRSPERIFRHLCNSLSNTVAISTKVSKIAIANAGNAPKVYEWKSWVQKKLIGRDWARSGCFLPRRVLRLPLMARSIAPRLGYRHLAFSGDPSVENSALGEVKTVPRLVRSQNPSTLALARPLQLFTFHSHKMNPTLDHSQTPTSDN
jgi:hypothetical protein